MSDEHRPNDAEHPDDDGLRARLRAADPTVGLSPADPDRVTRVLEETTGHDASPTESRHSGTRGRSRLTWLVAAAAVALIGLATAYVALRGPSPQSPVASESPAASEEAGSSRPAGSTLELALPAGAGAGRCLAPTPQALRRADVAFDGTVTEVAGGRVILEVTELFAGGPAERVEVGQAGADREALLLGVRFREGERYLVGAQGGSVMVCGFSGLRDTQRAELYERAFAGRTE